MSKLNKKVLDFKSENIENEVKKQIRVTKIQEAVLVSVAAAGLLSVALLAPNALKLLKVFNLEDKIFTNAKDSVNRSRKRLVKNGLLTYTKEGFLKLTPEGEKIIRRIELINYKIEKPRKWDKKWRVLIFDIKECKRNTRDRIREILTLIGFVRLQNSVWVYPYDCEDLINLTKADSAIGRELLYIVADRIENEKALLNHFKLKR
jgi:CRISPR/Cas system-associated endoribonuclease Cas2